MRITLVWLAYGSTGPQHPASIERRSVPHGSNGVSSGPDLRPVIRAALQCAALMKDRELYQITDGLLAHPARATASALHELDHRFRRRYGGSCERALRTPEARRMQRSWNAYRYGSHTVHGWEAEDAIIDDTLRHAMRIRMDGRLQGEHVYGMDDIPIPNFGSRFHHMG